MIAKPDTDLLETVQATICQRLARVQTALGVKADLLFPGKMLRTRLAVRLEATGACLASRDAIVAACAAIELVHTASLCHDDVIDEVPLRRRRPALWTLVGRSAAVLTGDLLLCEAMDLVVLALGRTYLTSFLAKVRQVVEAEARQELLHRGQATDCQTCLRVAREKTGPLFAFVAEVCAGPDPSLRQVLAQVGYLVGTAYQLADDLIDVIGWEDRVGKTLGTDGRRGKFTLPQEGPSGPAVTAGLIESLLTEAVETLNTWKAIREGLKAFIRHDLNVTFADQGVVISKEHAP